MNTSIRKRTILNRNGSINKRVFPKFIEDKNEEKHIISSLENKSLEKRIVRSAGKIPTLRDFLISTITSLFGKRVFKRNPIFEDPTLTNNYYL